MGCSEQNPDCGNCTRHPVPSTTVKKKKKKPAREILEMEKKPINKRNVKYISKNHSIWTLFECRFKQQNYKTL